MTIQTWRDPWEMLIQQLDMSETGRLALTTASMFLIAIAALKRSVLQFDALLSSKAAGAATATGPSM